jgi:CheY-like chemotaxis protein
MGTELVLMDRSREGQMRVLVVDDDPAFASDLVAVKPEEMIIDVAGGTEEAIELLHADRPDVMIVDLDMIPYLAAESSNEGLAVLGAVSGGYLGEIPVIIATDRLTPQSRYWCDKLGAVAVLEKSGGLSRILEEAAKSGLEKRKEVAADGRGT